MKSAFWESSAGALETLLNTGTFVQCDLISITFTDQDNLPTAAPPSPPNQPTTTDPTST